MLLTSFAKLRLKLIRTMSTNYRVIAECPVTKARVGHLELAHGPVETPVFMPVGTNGTVKGVTTDQMRDDPLNCQILLGNTYHLGHRPGIEIVQKAGGLHKFMNWDRNILTDSGGFQMVSLLALSEVTEEGVRFQSPHDGSMMLLTPERSVEIQLALGSDIIMQLDDVVHTLTTGERLVEAMHRTIRWLDRCIAVPRDMNRHLLFSILQGGLNEDLRRDCAAEMVLRDAAIGGYAIGGLSGGESKQDFWRIVAFSASLLPRNKPRYVMGIGYPEDLVVCAALGCDMFDCVWPTRTARFGHALTDELPIDSDSAGTVTASSQAKAETDAEQKRQESDAFPDKSKRQDAPKKRIADPNDVSSTINLTKAIYATDSRPISSTCTCYTCKNYSRALLHTLVTKEPIGCSLVSIHNIAHQLCLMRRLRASIVEGRFPDFVQDFMRKRYPSRRYPQWISDALSSVNITLS